MTTNHLTNSNMAQEVIDLTIEPDGFVATVTGQPMAMPRPRLGRHFYNPARNLMYAFARSVQEQIPALRTGIIFERNQPITVHITFYMRRPNQDFRGRIRGYGRLKTTASIVTPCKPDIDNLSKFVLDSLKGVAYADDSQVVKLVLCKVMDSEGECNGATKVEIKRFNETMDI
jgi:Holliday junction resolvase RusA-like endonuclease